MTDRPPPPEALDPIIHVAARLRIVAALAVLPGGDEIAFPKLQKLLEVTSGNLATHLRKLEDAAYIRVTKTIQGRTPVTWIRLTDEGRTAFRGYKRALRALLEPSLPSE